MTADPMQELTAAWRALDRRLSAHEARAADADRARAIRRAGSNLRWLGVGQVAQLAFGAALALVGGGFWVDHLDALTLAVSGALVHVYGVATAAGAGVTLHHLRQVSPDQPVAEAQRRLARLRHAYVVGGLVAGLPWAVLWLPALAVALALVSPVDLIAAIGPGMSLIVAGGGVVVPLGLAWLVRFARQPGREGLARALADAAEGSRLARARAELDAVEAFGREPG
jgi:hypothetical protein